MESKRKRIYAVLWVDDYYGPSSLSSSDVEWYHQSAGPISLAVEKDDRYPWSFAKTLKPEAKGTSPSDYLAHHYHPVRWKGALVPKRIFDSLRMLAAAWTVIKHFRGHFKAPVPKKPLRIGIIAILLAILAPISYLYFVNTIVFSISLSLYCIIAALTGLWYYVRSQKMWEYTISNMGWNESFLLRAKEEFEARGFAYPAVIRHGWNLPWESSMQFYMAELGVLADASAVPTEMERHPHIDGREIEWRLTAPYYASLKGDYNVPWNAVDEEDRGVLELPLISGNVVDSSFGGKEKELIAQTPDEGLVSCYIHPWDNFSAVKEWVDYLKENYEVKFVTAEEFTKFYMRKHPRPMLIDDGLNVKWAFKKEGRFYPVREVWPEIASLQILGQEGDFIDYRLKIETESEVPAMCIAFPEVLLVQGEATLERRGRETLIMKVSPGVYVLRMRRR